jgi:hypothetical protein
MENFLRIRGETISRPAAFTNGVMSTLIMGIDITPGDTYIMRFLEYQPKSTDRRLIELWNRLVAQPACQAVHKIHPILKQQQRLGEVFQYQPSLPALAARLGS